MLQPQQWSFVSPPLHPSGWLFMLSAPCTWRISRWMHTPVLWSLEVVSLSRWSKQNWVWYKIALQKPWWLFFAGVMYLSCPGKLQRHSHLESWYQRITVMLRSVFVAMYCIKSSQLSAWSENSLEKDERKIMHLAWWNTKYVQGSRWKVRELLKSVRITFCLKILSDIDWCCVSLRITFSLLYWKQQGA